MAHQNHIPPFPNPRSGGDDVNYTECFSIAREERIAGMTVDTNDSNQNPRTNPLPPPPPLPTTTKAKSEGHRPARASTRPDPRHYNDKVDGGSSRQRPSKDSSGGGPSPVHPAHELKSSRKDGANPPAERYPTHNSRHRQHKDRRNDGSSRRRPSKQQQQQQQQQQKKEGHHAIPPLPNFDENNAENITDLFKRAKEDLSSASPNVHANPTYQTTKPDQNSHKSCSCCAVM